MGGKRENGMEGKGRRRGKGKGRDGKRLREEKTKERDCFVARKGKKGEGRTRGNRRVGRTERKWKDFGPFRGKERKILGKMEDELCGIEKMEKGNGASEHVQEREKKDRLVPSTKCKILHRCY